MASIDKGQYKTYEELGEAIIAALPELKGRDPREIGLRGEEVNEGVSVVPSEWGDVDYRTAYSRWGGDWRQTLGETMRGMGEMVTDFPGTVSGMGTMGAAAAEAGIRELRESPQVQRIAGIAESPVEAAEKGAPTEVEAGKSLLSMLPDLNLVSPPERAAAEEMGREYVGSLGPAGFQKRPANWLANWAGFVPIRGALGAAAKAPAYGAKVRKAAQVAKTGLSLADPSTAPFEAVGLTGRAVKGTAKAGVNKVQQAQELIFGDKVLGSMRTEGLPLMTELMNGVVGFTTGTGGLFIQTMVDRAGTTVSRINETGQRVTEKASDIVRKIRQQQPGPGNDLLLRRALQAVDRVKKQAGEAYEAGKQKIRDLEAPYDEGLFRDLQERARGPLGDFNVGVTEKKVGIRYADVGPGGLPKTRPSGKYKLEFPDFGEGRGATATISDIGNGREKLNEIFTAFFDAKGPVTAEELMNFRRKIDSAINAAKGEGSKEARAALLGLRELVSEDLKLHVPGYREAMKDFETASIRLERYHTDLGLDPGRLNAEGLFRDINVEQSVGKLLGAFSEPQANATRLPLLDELQRVGGDQTLIPIILGIGSHNLMGSGLVVRSQLSEIGRTAARAGVAVAVGGVAGVVGGAGGLLALPAALMFSPRAAGEFLLRAGERTTPYFAKTRQRVAGAQEALQKISAAANEIDRLTGGAFRSMAMRKGMTLGLLMERLGIQSGADFSGQDFPDPEEESREESRQSLLERFSGMGSRVLNPLTGQPQ